MAWFTANRESLKAEHPDVTPQELTKLAMKEYKAISSNSAASNSITNDSISGAVKQVNGKRKLDETNGEKQSGVSKLARYGFKK